MMPQHWFIYHKQNCGSGKKIIRHACKNKIQDFHGLNIKHMEKWKQEDKVLDRTIVKEVCIFLT